MIATFIAIALSPSLTLAGTIYVHQATLTDHDYDATEWHFVINQIDDASNTPASIHVWWSNGQDAVVPRSFFTGGVSHYATSLYLDFTVTAATAVIYDGWSGQFNLSHGPYGVSPTETPTEVPPTETATEAPLTETPPAEVTETIPDSVTETVAGEEETPVPTESTVTGLPSTGTGSDGGGGIGLIAAAVIAVVMAGSGLILRRQSISSSK